MTALVQVRFCLIDLPRCVLQINFWFDFFVRWFDSWVFLLESRLLVFFFAMSGISIFHFWLAFVFLLTRLAILSPKQCFGHSI